MTTINKQLSDLISEEIVYHIIDGASDPSLYRIAMSAKDSLDKEIFALEVQVDEWEFNLKDVA